MDPIDNRIVAFAGDIRVQGPTPNIIVLFSKEELRQCSTCRYRWHRHRRIIGVSLRQCRIESNDGNN